MRIGAYLFSREVCRLVKKSGYLFTALYLKQCAASLQQAYGGVKTPHSFLPVPVSLTRSGFPRIISSYHRRLIYRRDDRADTIVQVYLSFFSLSKIILVAKRVNKATFKSIIEPWRSVNDVLSLVSEVKIDLPKLVNRYMSWISTISLF